MAGPQGPGETVAAAPGGPGPWAPVPRWLPGPCRAVWAAALGERRPREPGGGGAGKRGLRQRPGRAAGRYRVIAAA